MKLNLRITTAFTNSPAVTYFANESKDGGFLLHQETNGVITSRVHATREALDAAYVYARAYRAYIYSEING